MRNLTYTIYKVFGSCLAGALLLAAASCEREADALQDGVRTLPAVISARQGDEAATRTELGGNALTSVLWSPGDAITVFSAGQTARFATAIQSASVTADFTGTVSLAMARDAADDGIWGLYPYDADASYADGVVTTTLPSVQSAKANSFSQNLMLMVGRAAHPLSAGGQVSSDGCELEMDFYHVCSGIRFRVSQEDIESVTVTAAGGEALAGTFRVGLDGLGRPEVIGVDSASPSVTLLAPAGGFVPGVWYYIVTLPASLSAGLNVEIYTEDEEGTRKIRTPFQLSRKEFLSDASIDADVTLMPREASGAVEVALPDTWLAMDELGRALPDRAEAGRVKDDRHVLIFYSSWHCDSESIEGTGATQVGYANIFNVAAVQESWPGHFDDPSKWYGNGGQHPYDWGYAYDQKCFWGEPLFGYYRTTDPWVLRKHAEMLADAGVDAVAFDCTNGRYLWEASVDAIIQSWTQAMADGVKAPKLVFILNLSADPNSAYMLRRLYTKYYSNRALDHMWFEVDGKPLVMAYPESLGLSTEGPGGTANDAAILNRFTFRRGQPNYIAGDVTGNQWGWLQTFPHMNTFSGGEQITVSVAQNASDYTDGQAWAFNDEGTYGRSYTYADKHSKVSSNSYIYGYNFQEQWDNALNVHPPYVFVTQWNEWIALMQYQWPPDWAHYPYGIYGPPSFADQYDYEHSRDCEPTAGWGDHGDNYYYQLASNIRRYKGVSRYPYVSRPLTVPVDGIFSEWEQVSPDFRHYPGNTLHRDHPGHAANITYVNATGRNDIVDAKVARDGDYVYFYVETASAMTSYDSGRWMRLFINIDCNWTTGWKGYDFCLNYLTPDSATKGFVSRCSGPEWDWRTSARDTFDYRVVGNQMEIRVARSLLGVANSNLDFAFKWSDNMQDEGNVLDFYVSGDAAPGGRFNFHYKER